MSTIAYQDLLNASRADLDKTVNMALGDYHPIFETVLKATPEVFIKGKTRDWAIVHKGPGTGSRGGAGVSYPSGRQEISALASYVPTDWTYGYDLDTWELGNALDADELGMFSQMYPEAANTHIAEIIVERFVQGTSPHDTGGLTTLNGDVIYDPDGTGTYAQTGLLQFLAPTAQTSTTFGLSREGNTTNGVLRHSNGYGNVTAVGPDLMVKLHTARAHALKAASAVKYGWATQGFTDLNSWLAIWDWLFQKVVPVEYGKQVQGLVGNDPLRMAIPLLPDFKVSYEPMLDPSAGSPFLGGAGREGVMYGLNPKTLKALTRSLHVSTIKGKKVLNGLVHAGEFEKIPGGPTIKATYFMRNGIITNALNTHFVLEGTSRTS